MDPRDEAGGEIIALPALQPRQSDRRVDVVEGSNAAGVAHRELDNRRAFRHIGADDDGVRAPYLALPMSQLVDRAVEVEPAIVRIGKVAVLAVPGRLALQEMDFVPARGERLQQRAIGCRMTVPPGGG